MATLCASNAVAVRWSFFMVAENHNVVLVLGCLRCTRLPTKRIPGIVLLEFQRLGSGHHPNMVFIRDRSLQNKATQRIEDLLDEDSLQRTGAVPDIVSTFRQAHLGCLANFELHILTIVETMLDFVDPHVCDLVHVLPLQTIENDDLVDTIDELGAELLPHGVVHDVLHDMRFAAQHLRWEFCEDLCTQIGCHHNNDIREIYNIAVRICQPPVIEQLQKQIPDLWMTLLEFVEEQNLVRSPANGLREHAALFVADVYIKGSERWRWHVACGAGSSERKLEDVRVSHWASCQNVLPWAGKKMEQENNNIDLVELTARRCTNETGDGMLLSKFGHVDSRHGGFIVKHQLRQSFAQLGFLRSDQRSRFMRRMRQLVQKMRVKYGETG
mmetsp:Transcript_24618/g.68643  ORF Transcript_24618/g.68643 Transcript_24618/m.68643 type:complete len:384 (-) Transcript_24618:939-2090(-)